jgi:hypothetical protein
VTWAALGLTVVGWGTVWASALSIVPLVPVWLAAAVFFVGLALIPLCHRSRPKPTMTPPATQRHAPSAFAKLIAGALIGCGLTLHAAVAQNCPVSHEQLTKALKDSVKPSGGPPNGGFDNNEWAFVVTRSGVVCAATFSGGKPDDQWLGSRAIAAEKANTANALSLAKMAISTANLYAGSQPAGYLFGLPTTNPAVAGLVYAGDPKTCGSASDPLIGKELGGVVVFGGGLALYDNQGIVGGLGISGDTSCADHNVAWRVRHALGLDHVPNGVSPNHNDAIIYDMLPNKTSASGYGHPRCGGSAAEIALQIHSGFVPAWARVMKK